MAEQESGGWRRIPLAMMVYSLRILLAVALVALVGLLSGLVPMGVVWLLVNVAIVGLLAVGVVAVVQLADREPTAASRSS